jgi:hypothetical protein
MVLRAVASDIRTGPTAREDCIMVDMNTAASEEGGKRETAALPPLSEPAETAGLSLVLTTGDSTAKVLHFGTRPSLTIGRAEPAEVCVEDPGVSRLHARFLREPEGIRVLDLSSRNGTWVRGMRVTETLLAPGDSVVLGNTTVVVQTAVRKVAETTADFGTAAGGLRSVRTENGSQGINLRESLREYEAKLIREALRMSRGNQRRAAALLELPLRTFERKLRNMLLRQQTIPRATM